MQTQSVSQVLETSSHHQVATRKYVNGNLVFPFFLSFFFGFIQVVPLQFDVCSLAFFKTAPEMLEQDRPHYSSCIWREIGVG